MKTAKRVIDAEFEIVSRVPVTAASQVRRRRYNVPKIIWQLWSWGWLAWVAVVVLAAIFGPHTRLDPCAIPSLPVSNGPGKPISYTVTVGCPSPASAGGRSEIVRHDGARGDGGLSRAAPDEAD